MRKKIGRNESCPCGSGKKFKRCCIDLLQKQDDVEFSNPENFPIMYRNLRKEARIKQCLHPDTEACSNKIIKAHSIQNNKILKNISSNGFVYMPRPKPESPFAVMTKYGRKEATVFTGFCGYHDKVVFQPIEDNLFNKSNKHMFLYTYRCFAIEYHKKQEEIKMQKNMLTKKPSLLYMSKEDNVFGGMHMAVNDFESVKEQFNNALLNENYDILSGVIWEFDQSVNFAGTGFEAMERDLEGNKIQDILNPNIPAKHVFVMVFPEENKTYCIISWLKENDNLFSGYHEQLKELNDQQRRAYINNLLPMISENITVNAEALENWEDYKREEFGSLLWHMADLAEFMGITWDRLEPPIYDLFTL